MDLEAIAKGAVIGLSVAAPVGPIGLLVIRRTLSDGRWLGLMTGLGAATADTLYGLVSAMGLTAVSNALTQHQLALRLGGSVVLLALGIQTILARPAERAATGSGASGLAAYASTFLLTVSNPMTIVSFAAVLASVGAASRGVLSSVVLVVGVFLGSAMWWLLLSGGVSVARSRIAPTHMRWINRVSGTMLVGFAVVSAASVL